MITIIISAYGEPKATERAVNSFLSQNIKEEFKIIVSDPFEKVERYIKERFKDRKEVEFFLDYGEGKSYGLNMILNKICNLSIRRNPLDFSFTGGPEGCFVLWRGNL